MNEYKLVFSEPYLDAKEFEVMTEEREITFSANDDRHAEDEVVVRISKMKTFEWNGEIHKCQPTELFRSVKKW